MPLPLLSFFAWPGGSFAPLIITLVKQPFLLVHAGRPNCARYTPRSDSAFLSSNASTIAMVGPLAAVVPIAERPYALRSCAGVKPLAGVFAGGTFGFFCTWQPASFLSPLSHCWSSAGAGVGEVAGSAPAMFWR